MNASLIWITPKAEDHIAYCARVSSPHQDNPEYAKLLKYLIKHRHWSPFEMASACFEITTSRAIAQQILRHRSFAFQEFSQRYAEAVSIEQYEARSQDLKNRQNSIDNMSEENKTWFLNAQKQVNESSINLYKEALDRGVAKEQARFLLPLSTTTKLYMAGSIRSWIHYLDVRCGNGTQKEHMDIANYIKNTLVPHMPHIAEACGWTNATTTS